MLKLSAYVPAQWHANMLEVAKESEGKVSKNKEPEGGEWLVTRTQLMADGWRFEKGSNGQELLHLPQQTEQS